ncbi:MAG: glycosyltransferase family 2 protein [Gammaproteobacteria bacterium]|nr:glycosyltransferase family 2 protein [Gammaproteobacteria bacterium]
MVFWLALFATGYSYFFYPMLLLVLPGRVPHIGLAASLPRVSLIITARNESLRIQAKLENALAVDYPADRFEIIVASDASDDGMDELVYGYSGRGVQLIRAGVRKGKEYAQSLAIAAASGEILVFSDVATQIPADSIHKIVSRFSDPVVGAVSSEDRFVSQDGQIAGEGVYVRYEMWLRALESRVNSLVGLSGSFFAARKQVCSDWDITVPSDFNTALNCARLGYVAVSAPDVLGYYADLKDPAREYQRKVRTVLRGMAGLFGRLDVMNPWRYRFFAVQVISHKLMRWLVPWALLLLLICTALLWDASVYYVIFLWMQLVFYVAALLGWRSVVLRRLLICRLPFFFMQANIAVAQAGISYLLGRRVTLWEPSRR